MSDEIKNNIEPHDIEWEMTWSQKSFPNKPEKEMIFEEEAALAHLLMNQVVFLNSHWYKFSEIGETRSDGKGFEIVDRADARWTKEESELISVSVNCNDVFAWGCSDSDPLPHSEIKPLYQMWRKDPRHGAEIWCIIKRKHMPQRPVEKSIRSGGVWDLDALQAEHGLLPNHYDGVSGVFAKQKYEAYCTWEKSEGQSPLPFDAGWWAGWKRFTEANPGWYNAEWKEEQDRRRTEWRRVSGHLAA
jgi:hypothetical protein